MEGEKPANVLTVCKGNEKSAGGLEALLGYAYAEYVH